VSAVDDIESVPQRVLSRLVKTVPTEIVLYNRSNSLGRSNAYAINKILLSRFNPSCSLVSRHRHDHRVRVEKRGHTNGEEAFRPKPLE
jgi:hypothetical protein